MFENKIFKKIDPEKVKQDRRNMIFPDVQGFGADSLWDISDDLKKLSFDILKHYSRLSDFISFVSTGFAKKNEEQLVYTLYPPYTVSKSDVTYVLAKFKELGIITDYFFSSESSSFLICLNKKTKYMKVKELYSIGVACYLQQVYEVAGDIFVNSVFMLEKNKAKCVDVVCYGKDDVLYLYNIFLNLALETEEIQSHERILNQLSEKIIYSSSFPLTEYTDVKEIFLVSEITKSQLPFSKNIITIEDFINRKL